MGKSTFIRRALDLRDNAPRQKFSKKMSLDGVVYVIRLLEVSLDEIKIHVPGGITWPRAVDGQNLPQIDGVMVLYDVTQEQSVLEVPDVLCKSSRKVILLSIMGSRIAHMLCGGPL